MSRARERGFSLLEAVVAFAILALALGVLLEIFSRASLASQRAAMLARASALAESRLALVDGGAVDLVPGEIEGGEAGGMRWSLAVIPLARAGLAAGDPQPYRVEARVRWDEAGRERRLVLPTQRLGAPRP
ncbi:prepilin-type N-terminal cleavage/methylation domain-containing protein [Marichromatium bheemlicum]|uniref:Type II secretion system protein n=1 Tax=Marichromatium bheemlicum TaxID=365339 RepID=A0ABX1I5V7_9GAMM|nr:type II secretion system protein [Marichromatium bheemlicum]